MNSWSQRFAGGTPTLLERKEGTGTFQAVAAELKWSEGKLHGVWLALLLALAIAASVGDCWLLRHWYGKGRGNLVIQKLEQKSFRFLRR